MVALAVSAEEEYAVAGERPAVAVQLVDVVGKAFPLRFLAVGVEFCVGVVAPWDQAEV